MNFYTLEDFHVKMEYENVNLGEIKAFKDFKIMKDYHFNNQQKELTKQLTFLVSVPVFEYDKDSPNHHTDKVVAVLNAISESEKAFEIFNDKKKRQKLTNELAGMSNICNKII